MNKTVSAFATVVLGAGLQLAQPASSASLASPEAAPPLVLATLIGPGEDAAPVQAGSAEAVMEYLRKRDFDRALAAASRLVAASPDSPQAYNLQGSAYLGKGDAANARKSFNKALALAPDDIPALWNLAQLDIRQKDLTNARKRYERILAKDPDNVEAMIGMAVASKMDGSSTDNIAWLEKAKRQKPEDVLPSLALAMHYLSVNDGAKALAELTEALRSHKDNAELLELLGRVQIANGHHNEAVATYKRLVSLKPASPQAYFRLGMAQVRAKKAGDAAQSLRKAVQLKPDYAAALDTLARLELAAGRKDQALELAKELQRIAPRSPDGFALEGDLLALQKRYTEATKAYEAALSIQQSSALAVKMHAALTLAGEGNQANARLEQWLDDHPDDVTAWQYAAAEDVRAGRDSAAIGKYERLLTKAPNDANALNNLAVLYQRAKDPRALAIAERAYKVAPDSPIIADTLGWILTERGEVARGLEFAQKAAARAPSNPQIRYHLAVALAKSGDKTAARRELKSLLASKQKFPQRHAADRLLSEL
jgi:putative PEP-CTERM system TPR-repeat lipoprotein